MYNLKPLVLAMILSFTTFQSVASDYKVIATDKIDWGLLNPLRGDASPRAADLWGDRTQDVATGMLVKFNKEFSSPPHIHNITYRGVVIEGLMHNDDPAAGRMWLPSGSFWTQPAGESHITAANGLNNLIYLEVDSGPYLVLPKEEAFDSGDRPINVDEKNLVWLGAKDIHWLEKSNVQIAYLWGKPHLANGSFIKLPAGFKGSIKSDKGLKAVVVRGKAIHQWGSNGEQTALSPSSFFSSEAKGEHKITNIEAEAILYIHSNGRYTVGQAIKPKQGIAADKPQNAGDML